MRCFAVLAGAVHNDSTVGVVRFHIAGTLKQKVGVALPVSEAQPPKIRIGPHGSCLFAAGSPTDTVIGQDFCTFSTLVAIVVLHSENGSIAASGSRITSYSSNIGSNRSNSYSSSTNGESNDGSISNSYCRPQFSGHCHRDPRFPADGCLN